MKQLLQKPFIKNVVAPIIRGLAKQVPVIGTPIVEVITNMTKPTVIGDGGAPLPQKHNWVSIFTQSAIAIMIIIDLSINEGKNIKQILDFLGLISSTSDPIVP